mmetsp:Transcript_9651/g.9716  ORF Transcript_9651/g.9716 Transcript_9651/m.9716 type:complete len:220 (-) Transcript_9651:47-706(-)
MEFLNQNKEDANHNQYWYSEPTIQKIVEVLEACGGSIAFLSTPSLYFSISESLRKNAKVFDYDMKWQHDPGFVFYDFNAPDKVPEELLHSFDMIVIDPPFITHEVWEKYAITTSLLSRHPLIIDKGEREREITGEEGKLSESSVIEKSSPSLSLSPTPSLSLSRVILTTVSENEEKLKQLFGVSIQKFKPSIPHLVYQYSLLTNFESEVFSSINPEIPE